MAVQGTWVVTQTVFEELPSMERDTYSNSTRNTSREPDRGSSLTLLRVNSTLPSRLNGSIYVLLSPNDYYLNRKFSVSTLMTQNSCVKWEWKIKKGWQNNDKTKSKKPVRTFYSVPLCTDRWSETKESPWRANPGVKVMYHLKRRTIKRHSIPSSLKEPLLNNPSSSSPCSSLNEIEWKCKKRDKMDLSLKTIKYEKTTFYSTHPCRGRWDFHSLWKFLLPLVRNFRLNFEKKEDLREVTESRPEKLNRKLQDNRKFELRRTSHWLNDLFDVKKFSL